MIHGLSQVFFMFFLHSSEKSNTTKMQTATIATTATTTSNTTGSSLPKARFNWIFSTDKFLSTPSNRDGIPPEEELSLRQNSAVFIYELGTYLKVYVLISIGYDRDEDFFDFSRPHYCINTAVVYMHRFYMINSFKRFVRQVNTIFFPLTSSMLIYLFLRSIESMCSIVISCMQSGRISSDITGCD